MDKAFVATMQQEIQRQEAELVKRLSPEQAKLYSFITSMRNTVALADQLEWKQVSQSDDGTVTLHVAQKQNGSQREGTEGFVLRTAVRNQIPAFNGRKFSTRQMFEALKKKYPQDVDDERFASVSATLANLASKREIEKTSDGQRKVKFQAK